MSKFLLSAFLSIFIGSFFAQQLMINEVSQGSGSSEYVELVVIGNPICEGETIPCIDIRGVIIDDNNGFFQAGSGTGIASGALRFSTDPLWSCVPQGTYIVVYNEAAPNGSMPADDVSLTDGNCTLIIPGNSALLESTQSAPNTGDPLYPADPNWGPSQGWAVVSMNNTNDSFQIPNLGVNGTPLHSVSWGNNTNGSIIYFAGPVNNMVISFTNGVDNDWNNQNNWIIEDIATGQTPGQANSDENDAWIGTMNPTCRVNPALLFDVTNADCSASNGSITVSVSNASNVSYLWENGSQTQTISNLSTGTYTVVVTDNSTGCIYTDSAVVGLNNSTLAMNPIIVDESCTNLCDGTVNLQVSGGLTPYVITWSQNGSTINAPTTFCNGQYEVAVLDANQCQLTQTITVNTSNQLVYATSNDTLICLGDTISIEVQGASSYLWTPGNETTNSISVSPLLTQTYSVVITEGPCSVTETINVSVKNCDFEVLFPNFFTPNDDIVNAVYQPIAFSGAELKSFVILNRWGSVMYETSTLPIVWDGKIDGKLASDGVYFWTVIYTSPTEEGIQEHGILHLISK